MATLNTLEMEMRFPLWTLDKLSFKLNLTPQSLRKMCREKEIKSILIGRSYMISDDALQDFLNFSLTVGEGAAP